MSNFGTEVVDGKVRLYFHSALEGYKVELIKKDNRASFEMDCKHQLQYFEEKGYCTMAYESVIGSGRIRILEEEKNHREEEEAKVISHYIFKMSNNRDNMKKRILFKQEI